MMARAMVTASAATLAKMLCPPAPTGSRRGGYVSANENLQPPVHDWPPQEPRAQQLPDDEIIARYCCAPTPLLSFPTYRL